MSLSLMMNQICIQNGTTLQVISIRQRLLGYGTIQAIVENCLTLKELDLSSLYYHPTDSIDILVSKINPKIVKLSITSYKSNFYERLFEITDDHVEKLVKRCTNLTTLDLCGYPLLTKNTLRSIIRNLKNTLEKLGVADCTKITVDDLFELKAMPKLRILTYNCTEMSEFQRLKEQLPHLIFCDWH